MLKKIKEKEIQYQVTLLCQSGKFKPISCIVTMIQEDAEEDLTKNAIVKKDIIAKGLKKICQTRGWGKMEIETYQYLRAKVRRYEPEKIEAEKKARYEKIKEQKYKSGEWKRPKDKK